MIRIVFGKVFCLFKRAQLNKYNLMKLLCIFICSDVNLVNLAFLKMKKLKCNKMFQIYILSFWRANDTLSVKETRCAWIPRDEAFRWFWWKIKVNTPILRAFLWQNCTNKCIWNLKLGWGLCDNWTDWDGKVSVIPQTSPRELYICHNLILIKSISSV